MGSKVDLISCGCRLDKHSVGPRQGHHMENVLQSAISLISLSPSLPVFISFSASLSFPLCPVTSKFFFLFLDLLYD